MSYEFGPKRQRWDRSDGPKLSGVQNGLVCFGTNVIPLKLGIVTQERLGVLDVN